MWGPLCLQMNCAAGGLGMELQTILEVLQAYLMKWRLKFNNRKSKIMEVWKREDGTSCKIDEEIMEVVEEFKYLGSNVHLDKMANK